MPSGGGLSLNEAKPQSKKRQLVCIIIPRARRHWGLFHYLFIERVYTRPLRVSTRFATGHFAKPKCKNIAGKRIDRRNRSINDARTANCWRVFLFFFLPSPSIGRHCSAAVDWSVAVQSKPSRFRKIRFAYCDFARRNSRYHLFWLDLTLSFDWLMGWFIIFIFFKSNPKNGSKVPAPCRFRCHKKKKRKKKGRSIFGGRTSGDLETRKDGNALKNNAINSVNAETRYTCVKIVTIK